LNGHWRNDAGREPFTPNHGAFSGNIDESTLREGSFAQHAILGSLNFSGGEFATRSKVLREHHEYFAVPSHIYQPISVQRTAREDDHASCRYCHCDVTAVPLDHAEG
jgi:hypothetical protein